MSSYDIIPDIHGQFCKLNHLLNHLGWTFQNNAWRNSDLSRKIIFLGDFIDRGNNNGDVLRTVRTLVDAGVAYAIMGNHELNAIHFHCIDPETDEPVRKHDCRNKHTHESFLREFPIGSRGARDAVEWFKTLPFWLDLDEFRVVHAHWAETSLEALRAVAKDGVLPADLLIDAGRKNSFLNKHVELLTKGPEISLPKGVTIRDVAGQVRSEVRLAWWRTRQETWSQAVASVPDLTALPTERFAAETEAFRYPVDAKPLFFGHYWLSGPVALEARNTLCLDYSAGKDGPLIAYRFSSGDGDIKLTNILSYNL